MDEDVGAPLVGAHENISLVEPNENHQGTHKGYPYGDVTLGEIVGARETKNFLSVGFVISFSFRIFAVVNDNYAAELQAFGSWPLAFGYWLLAFGSWPLAFGC